MKYKVNEIFKSLQGEGFNLGKEAVFLRLSGCNLNCSWCDTDFSEYKEMTVDEILMKIKEYHCKNVIITGGEPAVYDLTELLKILKNQEYWIAIETNGTINLKQYNKKIDYISVSPKNKINQYKADELRVVNIDRKLKDFLEIEDKIEAKRYFLSPVEINGEFNYLESMKMLAEINKKSKNDWFFSIQMHKLTEIK